MQKATQMTATKRLVLTAVNIALCLVLPMAFHSIPNGGKIMLPMHIPVLLCGMVCGARKRRQAPVLSRLFPHLG